MEESRRNAANGLQRAQDGSVSDVPDVSTAGEESKQIQPGMS